jgi:hypothetical protein
MGRLKWIEEKDKFLGRRGNITWNSAFRPGAKLSHAPESYDLVVALDVLEHMNEEVLRGVMEYASMYLKPGGRMYIHNAWGNDSGVHPFHYDHSGVWPEIVRENDLFQLDNFWLVKQYVQTGESRG